MINYDNYRSPLKYAPVRNGKIAYLDQVEGVDVVLFVHMILSSSWLYRHLTPVLIKKKFITKVYTALSCWKLIHKLMLNATLKNGLSNNIRLPKSYTKGFGTSSREGSNRVLFYFFTQTCNALPDDHNDLLQSLDFQEKKPKRIADWIISFMQKTNKLEGGAIVNP